MTISNEHLIENTRSREDIYDGKIIDVKKLTVELPNGKEAYREVVYHKGAVAVIAVDGESMYFVKQFRISTEEVLLEVPAGKIEIDEHPDETVKKELKEEIGGESDKIEKLYEFYVSPGFSNELIHLYEAADVSFSDSQLEDDEFLDIVKVPLTELKDRMHKGEFRDGKTLVAVHHVLLSNGYL
ncbi:ADP-ribose pyrophosphatase [Jeotgalicoccus coquinae]|uniref:ADP-ribose pyrophosphatase n=1 Tax=Jeotgalicoccus coquinae TaxID=709509 RepID=A0A6V7R9S6_9STAP|nr:NUDIX hydrolase [Jeotgalicoccus coquinae]MBB6422917.1 ADP-ribose pyrophosphatase [Jeotgalicoccus coquinae]GGE12130.1 ADP-ribose pyrophosphatase [Jeotgalicoccus coquinae]CAD2073655.1 ADP-ribose pyrophosphatase [Jeotgalicoccus coquinae]